MPRTYLTQSDRISAANKRKVEDFYALVEHAMIDKRIKTWSELCEKMDIDVKTLRIRMRDHSKFEWGTLLKLSTVLGLQIEDIISRLYNPTD